MAWRYSKINEANIQQPIMNYVPGTASLIDDIDSKLERMIRPAFVDGDGFSETSSQDVASCV